MSLNSFFDTLDTDTKFNAWRESINSKLVHLKNTIPIENRNELNYVGIMFLITLIQGINKN